MIEIRNDFHNVAARVRIRRLPARLSPAQIARVRRILCGVSGCTCGGALGERGRQDIEIDGNKLCNR